MNKRDEEILLLVGLVLMSVPSRVRASSSSRRLSREELLALAKQAGFPDPKLAAAIALAESDGVIDAVARSPREISVGLWQINTMVHPYSVEDMRDPLKNAAAAFKISKGGTDWRPFTVYVNGRYHQFRTGVLA